MYCSSVCLSIRLGRACIMIKLIISVPPSVHVTVALSLWSDCPMFWAHWRDQSISTYSRSRLFYFHVEARCTWYGRTGRDISKTAEDMRSYYLPTQKRPIPVPVWGDVTSLGKTGLEPPSHNSRLSLPFKYRSFGDETLLQSSVHAGRDKQQ